MGLSTDFADMEDMGFLEALMDRDTIVGSLSALGGGAVGGVGLGALFANVDFFSTGSETTVMLKQAGTALALGAGAGLMLWGRNREMAAGLMGAIGARLGGMVAGFAGLDLAGVSAMPALAGYSGGGQIAAGARFHEEDPFGGVRVSTQDPAFAGFLT